MQETLFDLFENANEYKTIKSNDWKWTMAKDYPPGNGLKVFSCFACGGGSTMGYKLAGCEVLGCLEIDKKMNEVYIKNHRPKYNFLMDIRDFNKLENLPEELYSLDILDGSPPCTTFSMAGKREKSWGKKKKFREGQAEQTLDDLSFVFIETVEKLQPKVVVMENVEGLLLGKAFNYIQRIYKAFNRIGYNVKHWLLKAETMGVPTKRHRVFFIATRLKFNLDNIDMSFNYAPIPYAQYKDHKGEKVRGRLQEMLEKAMRGDKTLCDVYMRELNQCTAFGHRLVYNEDIMPTILAGHRDLYDFENKTRVSTNDIICAQTFPQDFDFGERKYSTIEYFCGMSVPPIMMKRIVLRLIESGLFKGKEK